MKFCRSSVATILATLGFLLLVPQTGHAIPAFARKFNVKCYVCHTIPPALNKNGYMFKRLGYRMPPDEMDGTKPAPKISELDKDIKFDITKALALVMQGSFTVDKTQAGSGGTSTDSTTSFNLDEAALFVAGAMPENNFSYFAHYELYQDGNSNLEQGFGVYTGGRANSSYFIKGGEIHMQEGEGTRAAMFYNLFPDPALTLTNVDPINFTLDQHPVGIDVGYTWASPYFKHVFAVSAKATNGLNADGSEVLSGSTRNSKDIWADADYWFGPDGGVTVLMYRGSKDQIQNAGTPGQFTYTPVIWRTGVFGNYLFFDKLDLLGGYLRSQDDWQTTAGGPVTQITSNGIRGEADYYLKRGVALMARYDRLDQKVGSGPHVLTNGWGVGGEHALTELGNVVVRATYNQEHDGDPVALTGTTDKLFKVDFRFMW